MAFLNLVKLGAKLHRDGIGSFRVRLLAAGLCGWWWLGVGIVPCLVVADEVTLTRDEAGSAEPVTVTGEIVDYTGEQLTLRMPSGDERTYAAFKVLRVTTKLTPAQRAGDERFAAGDTAGALSRYRAALEGEREKRGWVRRQILAQIVWCYRDQGDVVAAGKNFLTLLEDDPSTGAFDSIPLEWTGREPAVEVEWTARRWLGRENSPASRLMGASHLMGTALRGTALTALLRLSRHDDRRIAQLARCQLWRTAAFRASEQQATGWIDFVESMPRSLRAGPYLVAGRALSRSNPREAALALLHVPILYRQHRQLSAECLLEAARCLRRAEQPESARRIHAELLRDYPDSRAAVEAKLRPRGGQR